MTSDTSATADRAETDTDGSRLLTERRRRRLERTVEPLADRSSRWVFALPFVPIAVTVLAMTAGIAARGGSDPGWPEWVLILPLGVAYVAVVCWLYRRWDRTTWRAAAVVRSPSAAEVGAALVAAAAGIAIVVVGNNVAVAADFAPHERGRVTGTAGIAALVFGSVIAAPIAEEILFRGMLLGHLLSRGYGVVTASLLSAALFALVHVFMAGAVSLVLTGLLGLLLTGLRLRYDNLVGAWLMHLLVNVWGLLVTIGLLPILW